MIIASAIIKLQAPWVHSLKEKRMVVRSIIDKTKHKFNVSIAEIDALDIHQTIIIGLCCVSGSSSHANSMMDNIIKFIENHTDANVEDVFIEMR